MSDKICKVCGKGKYKYGSGLYDYYTCGHAFAKPVNNQENGKWVHFPSPYEKRHLNTNKL